jgi:hypothetical protein
MRSGLVLIGSWTKPFCGAGANNTLGTMSAQPISKDGSTDFKANGKPTKPIENVIIRSQVSVPQLEFITSGGPPRKAREDVASNRLVRAQAMRSYLHQKGSVSIPAVVSKDEASGTQAISLDGRTQSAGTGKFKLASWSRKNSKSKDRTMQKSAYKGDSSINLSVPKDLGPLNLLKVPLNLHTRLLLHHCTQIFPSLLTGRRLLIALRF